MSDPVEPVAPVEPSTDYTALMASVEALGAELKATNDRLAEWQQTVVVPEETPVAPINPADDPDNTPPTNWKALREEFRTEADKRADERYDARVAAEQEKKDAAAAFAADLDKQFDEMADEAVKQGLIPAITDADDADDAGKIARRELFGYAAKIKSTDLVAVAGVLKQFHDNGQHYDIASQTIITPQPVHQGRFAPVASSSARTTNSAQKIDYKQLHNTSLDQLAKRAMAE